MSINVPLFYKVTTILLQLLTNTLNYLSMYYRFRRVLIECGVLEPLCSLARSEDVELEIQRYAVLAIASKQTLFLYICTWELLVCTYRES